MKLTYWNELKTLRETKCKREFLSIDPLAGDFPSLSPYNYVACNPIKLVDPDGKEPDDHIKVNSTGKVTEVIKMAGPNRFFDSGTGKELKLNDAQNNPHDAALLSKKFTVGDQLYQTMSHKEAFDLIQNAGFEPARLRSQGLSGLYAGYKKAAEMSKKEADFPMVMYSSEKYNMNVTSTLEGFVEFTGLPFRINGSSTLYNPSDAGQYIWGAWMRGNGFTELQTKIGSNLNEWKTFGDSKGDQKAILDGYRNMDKFMNQ